jgi:hypothetical protein
VDQRVNRPDRPGERLDLGALADIAAVGRGRPPELLGACRDRLAQVGEVDASSARRGAPGRGGADAARRTGHQHGRAREVEPAGHPRTFSPAGGDSLLTDRRASATVELSGCLTA